MHSRVNGTVPPERTGVISEVQTDMNTSTNTNKPQTQAHPPQAFFSARDWPIAPLSLTLFLIRLFNAFTIKTFFQPDEFYQSLEPAHKLAFGYGYTSWEWEQGLRSSLHPLIYALGYKLAALVSGDYRSISAAPKVIGAVIATVGEVHLYVFVKRYTNKVVLAKTAVVLSVLNVFNWYVITRSFSNSLEMTLTTVALAYWPWRSKDYTKLAASCAVAFVTCIVRPTNAIIWVVLGLYFVSILQVHQWLKVACLLVAELALVLGATTVLDRYFYGFYTVPLVNFLEFNVVKNLSVFYGSSPWHFHLFQSVPVILMTYLPVFLHAVVQLKLYKTVLGAVVAATVACFSFIDHKEFRFLYPLMPIFMLFTAYSASRLCSCRKFRAVAAAIILVNVGLAYFFTRVNERGEIDVIDYMRDNNVTDFGLLMPCHSTPWQSHLHDPRFESSWFISCKPPLHLSDHQEIAGYRDESDQMFDDPAGFVAANFPSNLAANSGAKYTWPSRVAIFDNFVEMAQILTDIGYVECSRLFNSKFHWDDRRRGDIVVYKRELNPPKRWNPLRALTLGTKHLRTKLSV